MTKKVDLFAALATVSDAPPVQLTLGELIDGFTATEIDSNNAPRLAKWREPFAQVSAWAVTAEQLTACANALRQAGYAPASVNRDLSSLGMAYRWARTQRLTPRGFRSPTLGVERFHEAPRRVEVSRVDLERLLARAATWRDRRFAALLHLLVDTGARKSEVLERRWRDFDLECGTIQVDRTKTGVPRVLHFRQQTAALLRRVWRSRNPDDLPFEGKVRGLAVDFKKSWDKLTAEVGLPELHMHDLRHIAAADLLRSGVSLAVAAQVLGHSPKVLAARYGHLEVAALRAAQEQRWSAAA